MAVSQYDYRLDHQKVHEFLLRAVHLPELLNIVDDLKENSKSFLTEFADDMQDGMTNNKEDKLQIGNYLDSMRSGLLQKQYIFIQIRS